MQRLKWALQGSAGSISVSKPGTAARRLTVLSTLCCCSQTRGMMAFSSTDYITINMESGQPTARQGGLLLAAAVNVLPLAGP